MSLKRDDFSVLMSLYEKESPILFDKALSSIVGQELPPTEVVIVLDGPVGNELLGIIKKYRCMLPIKVVPIEHNVGLANALNVGLTNCDNEIIVRFDTDDLCFSSRFSQQVKYMVEHNDVDICGGQAQLIDINDNVIGTLSVPKEHPDIVRLIWSCPLIHPSVAFKKSKIQLINGYSPDAGLRQDDYELWIRAAEAGLRFHNIQEHLVKYRIKDDNAAMQVTPSIAFKRAKLGFRAWKKFDRSTLHFFGLWFPLVRSLLPKRIALWLDIKVRKAFGVRN